MRKSADDLNDLASRCRTGLDRSTGTGGQGIVSPHTPYLVGQYCTRRDAQEPGQLGSGEMSQDGMQWIIGADAIA